VEEFHRRITAAAEKLTPEFEIVFVNDGSPDDSLDVALRVRARDPRVRVVDLSRNFGHHRAIMTGLAHTKGERVFLMDVDLEEEPESLTRFWECLDGNAGVDVVYGALEGRKGGLVERLGGWVFYRVFNRLSPTPIPRNMGMARLMSRGYVDALLRHQEREVFLPGLWELTGFRQIPLPITKSSRGSTSYSLAKRVSLMVNAVTSFSSKPLVYIFYLGAFIMLTAGAAAAYLIFRWLTLDDFQHGWPSVIVSVWLLGGVTIFCIGIVGIYLSKVFMEVKDRPYTVVRRFYGPDEPR
jgi:putative glycosyltransferase